MSFWHSRKQGDPRRIARPFVYGSQGVAEISATIEQEMAEGIDPRDSSAIGWLLGWFWEADVKRGRAIRSLAYPSDRDPRPSLLALEGVVFSEPAPAEPRARYVAVAIALSEFMAKQLIVSNSTGLPVETVKRSASLHEAVLLVGALRMVEAHEALCRLLVAADASAIRERTPDSYRTLKAEIADSLLRMPADQLPGVWRRFSAVGTEGCFYTFVVRLRDRRAVPPLLEVWPKLSDDAKSYAITAFRNLQDTRAVPLLQELATRADNLLAPSAAAAVTEILRGSRDDAAQLLRATDSRHAGHAGETLLRPAAATDATTRPDELLRPGGPVPGENDEGS